MREIAILMLLAAIAGLAVGFICGAFRWRIEQLSVRASRSSPSRTPSTSALGVLVAKFIGGVLAIGSGMVLGREGPTVHIGAVLGAEAARRSRRPVEDARTLQSATSGAGLAVAFNAPLGGSLFVIEEIAQSVRARIVLPTSTGVAMAVATAWFVVGNAPVFEVTPVPPPDLTLVGVFAVFGLLTGLSFAPSRSTRTFANGCCIPPPFARCSLRSAELHCRRAKSRKHDRRARLGAPLEDLSPEIRPQDDLFRRVNGAWLGRTEIPDDKARWDSFHLIAEPGRSAALSPPTDLRPGARGASPQSGTWRT